MTKNFFLVRASFTFLLWFMHFCCVPKQIIQSLPLCHFLHMPMPCFDKLNDHSTIECMAIFHCRCISEVMKRRRSRIRLCECAVHSTLLSAHNRIMACQSPLACLILAHNRAAHSLSLYSPNFSLSFLQHPFVQYLLNNLQNVQANAVPCKYTF